MTRYWYEMLMDPEQVEKSNGVRLRHCMEDENTIKRISPGVLDFIQIRQSPVAAT